jgi:hypothetical protein
VDRSHGGGGGGMERDAVFGVAYGAGNCGDVSWDCGDNWVSQSKATEGGWEVKERISMLW